MKISLTGSLLGIAALALVGLGAAVAVLDSELTAQSAVVDKQVIQLANYKLEVKGLISDVDFLNGQVSGLKGEAEFVAGLNAGHEQESQFLVGEQQDWQTNSNKLQVSPDEITRTWASTSLPPDALQLLHTASRSSYGDSDKNSHAFTASEFPQLGLPNSAL
ncbi:hypothetical protein [Rheinheimera sp. MM224]|uniref:hypothetical protein n=1 Tax=Rheinheimera sp. MM224 TaxID=3019969 RepID=UPI0021F847AC|nr:hypothetical protein [Rheinheimera sp. MM224]CAI3795803.1 hypothetical protein JAMGFMIE_01409 [Rheinheimera sp. MM224]CAI3795964.1 hypothetical protein JAMGFMIE_01449 [Rheinheimera sp. MM224]